MSADTPRLDAGRAHEIDALFWGALAKAAEGEKEGEKLLFGKKYANGQGQYFRAQSGLKLGQVRRSDPDPKWRCVNRAEFDAHIRVNHPGSVVQGYEVIGDDSEVMAVLVEHAPHLLKEVEYVPDDVVADALTASAEAGEAAAPGIQWVTPDGQLGVYPDPAAVDFVRSRMRRELDSLQPRELPDAGREAS